MILKLIENKSIAETKVTVEYKEKNEQVNKVISFVENIEKTENCFIASSEGRLFSIKPNDVLYIESVDRKTFCYTLDNVYEIKDKLYEIEKKYLMYDYMRISKSFIVNINRIHSLKPDFGGKILATMNNGELLYISRQYAPVIKEKLGIGGGNK